MLELQEDVKSSHTKSASYRKQIEHYKERYRKKKKTKTGNENTEENDSGDIDEGDAEINDSVSQKYTTDRFICSTTASSNSPPQHSFKMKNEPITISKIFSILDFHIRYFTS